MRHSAVGGAEERVYRRTSCNHGLLARSSSDSELAVVATGYPGSMDVEAYEDEEAEEEEEDIEDSEEDDDDDDDCMGAEHNQQEQLPYPGFVSISMRYLDQNSRPRNWCLAMITNPYPFRSNESNFTGMITRFTAKSRGRQSLKSFPPRDKLIRSPRVVTIKTCGVHCHNQSEFQRFIKLSNTPHKRSRVMKCFPNSVRIRRERNNVQYFHPPNQ